MQTPWQLYRAEGVCRWTTFLCASYGFSRTKNRRMTLIEQAHRGSTRQAACTEPAVQQALQDLCPRSPSLLATAPHPMAVVTQVMVLMAQMLIVVATTVDWGNLVVWGSSVV